MKRLLYCTLALGLLLVAVALGGYVWFLQWEPPPLRPDNTFPAGTISVADTITRQEYTLGDFVVRLTAAPMPQLTITHRRRPDAPLLQSTPGTNFLATASGSATIDEARGSFFLSDQLGPPAVRQRLDSVQQQDDTLTLAGTFADSDVSWRLSLFPLSPERLGFEAQVDDSQFNRLALRFVSSEDEHFFGFGEQFTFADMKGRLVPILVSEQGIGRGAQPLTKIVDLVARSGGAWHTTYATAPWFLTNRQRGVYLNNTTYSAFDLRDDEAITITAHDTTLSGGLVSGENPEELVVRYTEASGRMRKLPDWILEGAIVGMQGGTDKVRAVWEKLRQHDVPLAGFWLQDWVGQRTTSVGKQLWWNWERDEDRYPGWEDLVSDLNDAGLEVMTYVNPFLADVSEKPTVSRHLYEEARDKGFLVSDENGAPRAVTITSFDAGLIDLTNPDAYDWLKGIIRDSLVGSGARGWMADFGEALPFDVNLHHGDAAALHNAYPVLWSQLNREVVDALPDGDAYVFFCRSGFLRSPAYATLFWEGDQSVTWDAHDGIKSAVTGLLTSGLSGYAFNHSDIGGYTSIARGPLRITRSKELLLRWMELSAMTTVFRTHEGITPDENVQVYEDPETLAHFAHCAKLHGAWTDLRKRLVQEASANGLPVVRHPFLYYPDDPEVQRIRYESFLVGNALWVAPVLDPGVETQEVYLPAGRWRHVWSGEIYGDVTRGGRVTVPAPLGQPPIFHPERSATGDLFRARLVEAGLLEGPAPKVFQPKPLPLQTPAQTAPPIAQTAETTPPLATP